MSSDDLFSPDLSKTLEIPAQESWPKTSHRFEPKSVWAVKAALASGRPLLLRGEPGIGKSQLARAAACWLGVPFLPFVVDKRTDRDELFYTFDDVARLAQAQVSAVIAQSDRGVDWQKSMAEENFIRPGVMWKAIDWQDAHKQSERFLRHARQKDSRSTFPDWKPSSEAPCGPVVLIDEIDKAESSVPNGLLECMGNLGFQIPQLGKTITLAKGAKPPLVIITTNEDRELPAAFLRRCLVLQMEFPEEPEAAKTFLIDERARVFWNETVVSEPVCQKVVSLLLHERKNARLDGVAIPGAAEFLDILRVLVNLCHNDDPVERDSKQLAALAEISDFSLKKNREERS
jgi:MoxR-like ATPase